MTAELIGALADVLDLMCSANATIESVVEKQCAALSYSVSFRQDSEFGDAGNFAKMCGRLLCRQIRYTNASEILD